jgi:transposase
MSKEMNPVEKWRKNLKERDKKKRQKFDKDWKDGKTE